MFKIIKNGGYSLFIFHSQVIALFYISSYDVTCCAGDGSSGGNFVKFLGGGRVPKARVF